MIEKLVCESNEPTDPPFKAKPNEGNCRLLSLVEIKGKVWLPFKRKVSMVEAVVKRKNESARKRVNILMA